MTTAAISHSKSGIPWWMVLIEGIVTGIVALPIVLGAFGLVGGIVSIVAAFKLRKA